MSEDFFQTNAYGLQYYPAQSGGKRPFALICPGGGYCGVASFVEGEPFAQRLNTLGYHAFVLRYRVKEKAKNPAPLDDLATALREILTHADTYRVITDGYSLWGSSAGGHLAGLFAGARICRETYHLPQPAAVILVYPVISMGPLGHKESTRNFLGAHPTAQEIHDASVDSNVDDRYPPTFLWNTREDQTVDPENGVLMKNALARHHIEHRFLQFEKGRHGLGLGTGTECEPWFDEAVAFWEKQMDR